MSDRDLTEAGREAVAAIARRHGVGADVVLILLEALERGGGLQAQFSHPDLGGLGQWSRGGMIMVGDMFNTALKARVDALCTEVAGLVGDRALTVGGRRPDAHGAAFHATAFHGTTWWPETLGTPSTSGAQNDLRYAFFPETRRLAVGYGGNIDLYDTGEHRINGVSQQQGASQDLVFTSQLGRVALHELPRVGAEPAAEGTSARRERGPSARVRCETAGNGVQTQSQSQSSGRHAPPRPPMPPDTPVAPKPSTSPDDDVFARIERLHALQTKGILTEVEFAEKKKELLARI